MSDDVGQRRRTSRVLPILSAQQDLQVLRRNSGAVQHRFRCPPGRGSRHHRRERRRQIDADQDPVRASSSRLRAPSPMTARPSRCRPTAQAEALGIVLIHQEFNLAEHLTVVGFDLSRPRDQPLRLPRRAPDARAGPRRCSTRCMSHVDPDARINTLSVADKQMVEIAKAISRDARVLIMDEPTAVLSRGRDRDAVRADPPADGARRRGHLHLAQARRGHASSPTG